MGDFGVWQLIAWWAAACVVVAAGWLAGGVQQKHLWTDREIAWVLWHWFTGAPLETGRGPSVGVWRRTANGAVRTSVSLAAMAGVHSFDTHTVDLGSLAAHAVAGVAAVCAVTLGVAWAAMRIALYLWWVRPIHHALLSTSGWEDIRPGRWVKVPRRWEDHRLGVRIKFPRNFDVRETNREKVVAIVMTKADWGDISTTWRLAGRHSRVIFKPMSRLPDRVAWTDRDSSPNQTVRDMVTSTKKGTIWLGMGRDGAQVTYHLDPHPHIMISGATGAGKSAIARSITAQLMAQDNRTEVVNIDSKHLSHPWLRNLPGATNLYEIDDIAAGLSALADEVKSRVAHVDTLDSEEIDPYIASLARKVVIVEEAPTLMDELNAWWRKDHPGKPCPATDALRLLLNMSRIAGYHVLGIAQRADSRAMGGAQARENYVLRILPSGYTHSAWKMLVPEIDYQPSVERPGWAMVCHGSTATETQMLWITDEEARDWVRGLRATDPATDRPRLVAGGSVAKQTVPPAIANHGAWPDGKSGEATIQVGPRTVGSGLSFVTDGLREIAGESVANQTKLATNDDHDDIELTTIREATESGLIPMTLGALQRASLKEDFPHPVIAPRGKGGANRYLAEALVRWWENRPRSPAARKQRDGWQPLVYFIVRGRGGKARYGDVVKIGRTDNLTRRLDEFADHPDDVIRTIEVGSTEESVELEREFHKRWADLRIYEDREHFRIEGDLAKFLEIDSP